MEAASAGWGLRPTGYLGGQVLLLAVRRGQLRGARRGSWKLRGPQDHQQAARLTARLGAGGGAPGAGPSGHVPRPRHVTSSRAAAGQLSGENAHLLRVAIRPWARGFCRSRLAGAVQPSGSAESRIGAWGQPRLLFVRKPGTREGRAPAVLPGWLRCGRKEGVDQLTQGT